MCVNALMLYGFLPNTWIIQPWEIWGRVIFNLILVIDGCCISCEIALRLISMNLTMISQYWFRWWAIINQALCHQMILLGRVKTATPELYHDSALWDIFSEYNDWSILISPVNVNFHILLCCVGICYIQSKCIGSTICLIILHQQNVLLFLFVSDIR